MSSGLFLAKLCSLTSKNGSSDGNVRFRGVYDQEGIAFATFTSISHTATCKRDKTADKPIN